MRYFPIFMDLHGQAIVVSGAGETAVAKLRLLLKTTARITVYGRSPDPVLTEWAAQQQITLVKRPLKLADLQGARLVYAANDHPATDAKIAALAHQAGVLVNVVDTPDSSDFITPAIVDRDPVTVAIGTEGSAPVLARRIKSHTEAALPSETGTLARIANEFRDRVEHVPAGRTRRAFWQRYFDHIGPAALSNGGEQAVREALEETLNDDATPDNGRVSIIGAGPGDPDLLTLRARRMIGEADVVIYDRLVSGQVLEIARREALQIEVGKTPGGTSWVQQDINALMVQHALRGAHVVRLKSGDPAVYGRLDEEMDALDAASIPFDIVPGITSAAAAAAAIKVSLTRRHRNSSFRILTGHDVDGFADQDWRALSNLGATAAIYMGVRAARFLQGRLLMHGADPETPMTVIENVSRSDQKIAATSLDRLPDAIRDSAIAGPAIIFLGLEPRAALARMETLDSTLQEAL